MVVNLYNSHIFLLSLQYLQKIQSDIRRYKMKPDTHQQQKPTTHKIVNIFVNTVVGISVLIFVCFKAFQQLLGL